MARENDTEFIQNTSLSLRQKTFCLLLTLFPVICLAQDNQDSGEDKLYSQIMSVIVGSLIIAFTLYKAIVYVKDKRFDSNKPGMGKFLFFWALPYPLIVAVASSIIFMLLSRIMGIPEIEDGSNFPDYAYISIPMVGMWIASIPLAIYMDKTGTQTPSFDPVANGDISVTVVDSEGRSIDRKTSSRGKGKFTSDYYTQLRRITAGLQAVKQEIMQDSSLAEELDQYEEVDAQSVIAHHTIYDLVQIVKLFNSGYYKHTDIEVMSIVLIYSPMMNDESFESYEHAKLAIESGIYKDSVNSIMRMGDSENYIDISSIVSTDETVDTTFALLPFLKLRKSQLFDRYSSLLFEFAQLIANIDGTTTTVEINLLHKIQSKLQNPISKVEEGTAPPPIKNKTFTKDYYNLLIEVADEVKTIYKKLLTDKSFINDLGGAIAKENLPSFISLFIQEDISKITKLLNDNFDEADLEITGAVLLSNVLMDEEIVDYAVTDMGIKKGIYLSLAKMLIERSNSESMLSMQAKTVGDEDENPIEIDRSFTIVPILELRNNPLFDEYTSTLYHIANVLAKADGTVTKEEENKLKIIYKKLHSSSSEDTNDSLKVSSTDDATLEDIQKELNSLVGLDDIKKEVETLINFIKVQKAREEAGLKATSISYHIVFTGNPGTGKTTVARIIAKIYKALGILTEGQLVETDRSGLIAEYVGQTAGKVNKTVDSALNGVLFIDEAYALVSEGKNDYGKEALATLLKRMEDDRDKLVVIVAGYTNEMKAFIDTNPGLRSRFNRYFEFGDYTPQELLGIYKLQCKKLEYILTEEAEERVLAIMQNAYSNRNLSFGNGRFSRNLFEKTLELQANRIATIAKLDKKILTTITDEDIPNS